MCLAEGTGAKQSSELTLIENYFWICWARPAAGPYDPKTSESWPGWGGFPGGIATSPTIGYGPGGTFGTGFALPLGLGPLLGYSAVSAVPEGTVSVGCGPGEPCEE